MSRPIDPDDFEHAEHPPRRRQWRLERWTVALLVVLAGAVLLGTYATLLARHSKRAVSDLQVQTLTPRLMRVEVERRLGPPKQTIERDDVGGARGLCFVYNASDGHLLAEWVLCFGGFEGYSPLISRERTDALSREGLL